MNTGTEKTMAKTFLYRFFGLGRVPEQVLAPLRAEGLLHYDEGIRGTVTYKNFRAPGRYSNWKRQWFSSTLALTEKRLWALRLRSKIINVPLDDPRILSMEFTFEEPGTFCVAFDAGLFEPDRSGRIEYRFKTPIAKEVHATLPLKLARFS